MNWHCEINGTYRIILILILIILPQIKCAFFEQNNLDLSQIPSLYSSDTNSIQADGYSNNDVTKSQIASVVITNFKLLTQGNQFTDGIKPTDDKTLIDSIQLGYYQNDFTVAFTSSNTLLPAKASFAYLLEGFDRDWIQSGNRRYATYLDIPPGSYMFRVKTMNEIGELSEDEASIKIIISPPWWRTGMAYGLYIVFIGFLFYGLRKVYINQIYLQHQLSMEHYQTVKLQELDGLKSRFFANISHEFRTPLTLILGPVDQVLADINDQLLGKKLKLVKHNAEKLLGMINQLLDFSKLEAGHMKLRIMCGDYVSFIRRIVNSFQSWADRKQIVLSYHSNVEQLPAYMDPEKIEHILSNLLSNAMKYTPQGGTVVVTLERESRQAKIIVKDTGTGIAHKYLDHIFDLFYRIDDAHHIDGAGIGLAFTKNLVDLHKGQIYVESEEGKGTAFTIELPITKDQFDPETIISDTTDGFESTSATNKSMYFDQDNLDYKKIQQKADGKQLILIVEDNADVREYTKTILGEAFQFIEAVDGEDGEERAKKEIPDLIISDVMMPKIDGYELCKRIKIDQRTSHIPVILLTAKASNENKLEGLETGADDYITKPFDACELKMRVKNLIEQRKLLRERFRREITLQPKDIAITPVDERFVTRIIDIVESHMSDQLFTTEQFAKEMFLSRMQFHRKIRALTDLSPWQFVRKMRVRRAADLLANRAGNIAEIASEVGYDSPSKFAHAFKEEFGVTPSAYQENRN